MPYSAFTASRILLRSASYSAGGSGQEWPFSAGGSKPTYAVQTRNVVSQVIAVKGTQVWDFLTLLFMNFLLFKSYFCFTVKGL